MAIVKEPELNQYRKFLDSANTVRRLVTLLTVLSVIPEYRRMTQFGPLFYISQSMIFCFVDRIDKCKIRS